MLMGSRCRVHAALTLGTALVLLPYVCAADGQEGGAAAPFSAPSQSGAAATADSGTVPAVPPAPPPLPLPPPDPEAQAQLHANGRLSGLLCQGQPLRALRCRWGQASGLVTTYHASGSVAEVLQFRDGLLDGLIEVYDPGGHLIERTLYRGGLPQPMPTGPTNVQAAGEPSLPPPPAVEGDPRTGAPPVSGAPNSAPDALPRAVDPPALPVGTLPPPTPGFGLGLRALVGMLTSDLGGNAYTGLQVVVAPHHGGILPELAVGVATVIDTSGLLRRLDVPMSVGYLWNLSRSVAPLYLAATLDIVYARRDLLGAVPGPTAEEAWLVGGSGGVGINLPAWGRGDRGSGRLLLDLRLGGTGRVDGNPPLRIPRDDAEPAVAIGSQFRVLFTMTTLLNLGG